MLNSNSILLPTRAVFFLKIPFNQVTENIRFDTVRYCYKQGFQPSGFFKIKEGIEFPEEDYIRNILSNIANKCQKEGDIVIFTNFNLPLSSFTIINQAMKTGKLTVRQWKL